MPKSKRDRVVPLTKVKKKGKAWKDGLIESVRACLEQYQHCYVFAYDNMRNDKFKELREDLKDTSRFCMGSTKVLKVALGRTTAEEHRGGVSGLGPFLRGNVGLFFTNLDNDEAQAALVNFSHVDYARAGSVATEAFSLPEGPVIGPHGDPVPHTLERHLRQNGLPTRLNKGVVELVAPHSVCRAGDKLTPQQAAVLRVFDKRMSEFRLRPVAAWHAEGTDGGDIEEIEPEYATAGDVPGLGGEDDGFNITVVPLEETVKTSRVLRSKK
ncbi:unnamed protein product [Pedinophyceae sp. YPF-701]|nr:unnamed protein product [Pedinophyceae sp. YPF-701]